MQLRDLAKLTAFHHLHTKPIDHIAVIHRDDGDNEFMNNIASELITKVMLCTNTYLLNHFRV